jgi:hypothetical protein
MSVVFPFVDRVQLLILERDDQVEDISRLYVLSVQPVSPGETLNVSDRIGPRGPLGRYGGRGDSRETLSGWLARRHRRVLRVERRSTDFADEIER